MVKLCFITIFENKNSNNKKIMDNNTTNAIRLAIENKTNELSEQLKELNNLTFSDEDLYFKTYWSDSQYPGSPSEKKESKTLDEAVLWLSKQEHPMGVSGCYMHIGLYIDLLYEPTLIQSFDAKKLAREKRSNNRI